MYSRIISLTARLLLIWTYSDIPTNQYVKLLPLKNLTCAAHDLLVLFMTIIHILKKQFLLFSYYLLAKETRSNYLYNYKSIRKYQGVPTNMTMYEEAQKFTFLHWRSLNMITPVKTFPKCIRKMSLQVSVLFLSLSTPDLYLNQSKK
jgi:hypothetical protein